MAETYLLINRELHYLWRAVDHEGEVLASFFPESLDRKAGLSFFQKSIKRCGRPYTLLADKLRTCAAAWATSRKMAAGCANGPKTSTCRFDDENGQSNESAACEAY
ncbi:DDE-type integrase/transposase/recombinase [Sulfitobacter aestuariivivens]|uniref:DDE-type integrase/transposase/recombinase n=1 Tax=Sulfitobacter aestuariivivens TaxID=2766981 RepID=A0A927D8V0_9RHOB|nr:DDE-type integrase/transposase/recombinase [Sulfitobacter aestuariivivens]MBD3666268.1 DDE-type integrase/transposase/recombinase [Sulfitobacter aestuariivivens]